MGLAARVLLGLARPGTAAHADILYGPAEARHLVPLKMREAYEYIRVHDRPADPGFLHVFAPGHGNRDIVGTLEAVADDYRTARRKRAEAILPGAFQVLQGVLALTRIHGIAVGQKGKAAQVLDRIGDGLGVVGPQITDVAQFSEVHFYGDEFPLEIDPIDARGLDQLFQFGGEPVPEGYGAEIRKVNFRFLHFESPDDPLV